MSFQCEFCSKTFAKESTVVSHMCEAKRRRMEQHERGVQLGLNAYLQFYRTMNRSGRARTFDDFAASPYYKAFVKFGRYCVDIRAVNPARFIDWLLKNQKRIDNWCSDRMYSDYLVDLLQSEAVSDALIRSIESSVEWGERNGYPPHDWLRYGNRSALCHSVVTGKLSPWAVYCSESGQALLNDLDSQQLTMIWPYIDSDRWQKILADSQGDRAYATEILKQAGW